MQGDTTTEGAAAAAVAARLDRLPSSRYLWRLVLLLAAGAFFEIYDLLMTAYVSPGIIRVGVFSEKGIVLGLSDQATFASVTFAGLLVGTLFFGSVADRFGRRSVFTFALLWYAAATAAMAAQSTAEGIFIMRFIAGIGLGVEMITIDTFLAELVPQKFRGRAFAATHGLMFLSVPTVAFLSWALLDTAPLGIDGWRWVVAFPSLGAIAVWWIRRELPESPRWLVQRGRYAEAEAILARMEDRIERETGRPLTPISLPTNSAPSEQKGHGTLAEIFRPPYRRRAIMLAVFNFFQTIGFYGFGNWVPKLVSGQGINISDSLLYSSLIALAYPIGPFLFMLFADRFERKWQIVLATSGTAVFGMLFTMQSEAWLIIALGILITFSANLMSYAYHTYQAELFPTRIRSRAVGLTYSFSRLSTIFTSFMIAFFARDFANIGVFMFIGSSMLIAAGSIGLFGPLTKGRTLEEINGE